MKVIKKISVGGVYARKVNYEYEGKKFDADIKNGDTVKILSEGSVVVGQYGDQEVYKIETRNGEKNFTLNQASKNILIDELGDETKKWIGKELNILTKKTIIAGKKVIVAYLVTGNYSLDEYGELVKEGTATKSNDGVDIIDYPEDDISLEDIPF